jgi:hypothetical protein
LRLEPRAADALILEERHAKQAARAVKEQHRGMWAVVEGGGEDRVHVLTARVLEDQDAGDRAAQLRWRRRDDRAALARLIGAAARMKEHADEEERS